MLTGSVDLTLAGLPGVEIGDLVLTGGVGEVLAALGVGALIVVVPAVLGTGGVLAVLQLEAVGVGGSDLAEGGGHGVVAGDGEGVGAVAVVGHFGIGHGHALHLVIGVGSGGHGDGLTGGSESIAHGHFAVVCSGNGDHLIFNEIGGVGILDHDQRGLRAVAAGGVHVHDGVGSGTQIRDVFHGQIGRFDFTAAGIENQGVLRDRYGVQFPILLGIISGFAGTSGKEVAGIAIRLGILLAPCTGTTTRMGAVHGIVQGNGTVGRNGKCLVIGVLAVVVAIVIYRGRNHTQNAVLSGNHNPLLCITVPIVVVLSKQLCSVDAPILDLRTRGQILRADNIRFSRIVLSEGLNGIEHVAGLRDVGHGRRDLIHLRGDRELVLAVLICCDGSSVYLHGTEAKAIVLGGHRDLRAQYAGGGRELNQTATIIVHGHGGGVLDRRAVHHEHQRGGTRGDPFSVGNVHVHRNGLTAGQCSKLGLRQHLNVIGIPRRPVLSQVDEGRVGVVILGCRTFICLVFAAVGRVAGVEITCASIVIRIINVGTIFVPRAAVSVFVVALGKRTHGEAVIFGIYLRKSFMGSVLVLQGIHILRRGTLETKRGLLTLIAGICIGHAHFGRIRSGGVIRKFHHRTGVIGLVIARIIGNNGGLAIRQDIVHVSVLIRRELGQRCRRSRESHCGQHGQDHGQRHDPCQRFVQQFRSHVFSSFPCLIFRVRFA